MKELIGKKITGLRVNDDQTVLAFDTDQGAVYYIAYGDCCSESWFADITGVGALIGGTVRMVDEVKMDGYNVDDGRGRQESDQAYGYKITTDKGYADIVFRNSSNGYYGGWLDLLTSQEEIDRTCKVMIDICDDWHA